MNFSKKDQILTVRIDEDMRRSLDDLSDRFGISKGFMVRRLLKAGMERQGKHCITLYDKRRTA